MVSKRKGLLAIIIGAVIVTTGGTQWPRAIEFFQQKDAPEISQQAQNHILHGDQKGGGHKFGTGKTCKTEFPKSWDEEKIIANIRKVAANDNLKWKKQKNGYYVAAEKIDGVRVRVVLDKERDDVVTAYPINIKRSNCPVKVSVKAKNAAKIAPAANDNVPSSPTDDITVND